MDESSLHTPFSVPMCLELALEGTRGRMAFEPIITEMRRVAQSGSVFQTGPHSQECGHETLFCVFLPYLLLGMLCATPPPSPCKASGGPGHKAFWSVVEATQVPLRLVHQAFPSFPSLVVLDFPDRPAWSQKAPCPQAGTSPSSLCWNHFCVPP